MRKTIFIAVLLGLLFTVSVMAQSQDARPIQDDDFAFGRFKLQQIFDKKLAEFIYGKGKEVKLSAKEMDYVSKVSGENRTYTGNYTVYFYKTAAFMVQENKIVGAASTCEKGSNPRNLNSFSSVSSVIKAYGQPLDVTNNQNGWHLLSYYNTSDENAPTFCIFAPNKENNKNFLRERRTMISWGTSPVYSSLCAGAIITQEMFIERMDALKEELNTSSD